MRGFGDFFPVTEAEKAAIRKDFGKSESDLKSDVKLLREWLKKQPQIPELKDDHILENILLRNKFRIEKTKLKIDKYFAAKTVFPEFFETMDPALNKNKTTRDHITFCPMPKLTPKNERIVYLKLISTPDADFDYNATLQYFCLQGEIRMLNDYTSSEIGIYDMENYGLSHIRKLDMVYMAKTIHIYLECFSGRFAQMYFVNQVGYVDMLLGICKAVLPVKLLSKIKFLKSWDELYQTVPKEYLPMEIGGTSGISIHDINKKFSDRIVAQTQEIVDCCKMGTNEKLRIGEPAIKTGMFGVDGTFKNLNLD